MKAVAIKNAITRIAPKSSETANAEIKPLTPWHFAS
jgi:hypothetical protein